MLEEYLNLDHGLELTKGNTNGRRGNENGILYFAVFCTLQRIKYGYVPQDYALEFKKIMKGLEVESGLYDRGKSDKLVENPKRTISHDNISGIAALSVYYDTTHAREIANYGLEHFFVYNNNQKGFRAPMNPGNYSVWLALGDRLKILQYLFLPFFIINMILTLLKPKGETSSKILYLVELTALVTKCPESVGWRFLSDRLHSRLRKQYGACYLQEIMAIYYKDVDHPINVFIKGF